jgi:DNA-binding NarL/FixJ family response regulator
MLNVEPKSVTVAFVDDHPAMLAGLSAMFSETPRFRVLATGGSADDARLIAEQHRPELLFVDLSMPGDVFAVIGSIAKRRPKTRVIVLTAFSGVDSALRALDAGATGFVLKGSSFDDLFDAAETVLRGEMYVTKQYFSQVMSGLRNRNQREGLLKSVKLTVREKQIVRHLLEARTNREIASSLDISEQTVKNYMSGLMSKFHARNRVEVVIAAQKNSSLD